MGCRARDDARFQKIEDAAHAVFLDQPDRFDELLEKFVKDSEPDRH